MIDVVPHLQSANHDHDDCDGGVDYDDHGGYDDYDDS